MSGPALLENNTWTELNSLCLFIPICGLWLLPHFCRTLIQSYLLQPQTTDKWWLLIAAIFWLVRWPDSYTWTWSLYKCSCVILFVLAIVIPFNKRLSACVPFLSEQLLYYLRCQCWVALHSVHTKAWRWHHNILIKKKQDTATIKIYQNPYFIGCFFRNRNILRKTTTWYSPPKYIKIYTSYVLSLKTVTYALIPTHLYMVP